jgi:hypothetical protein
MCDREFNQKMIYYSWKKELDEIEEKFKKAEEKRKGNGVL